MRYFSSKHGAAVAGIMGLAGACSSDSENDSGGNLGAAGFAGSLGGAGAPPGSGASGTPGSGGAMSTPTGSGGSTVMEPGGFGVAGATGGDGPAGVGGSGEGSGGAESMGGADGGVSAGGSSGPGPMGTGGTENLPPLPDEVALPIVFVHGFAGSAQQFESQAMRYAANGYPLERIYAYDHDGAGTDVAGYANGVDGVVDTALAESGAAKVYLVGHSRGTFVSSTYLGDAQRAAKVAKYISLDGSGCGTADRIGIPCVAPSQGGLPGQAHVEVATSKESFVMQYEFLVGEAPDVVDIVKQSGPVTISGRAVDFPANTGRAGTTLEIYAVDSATGARTSDQPVGTFEIDASGDWGPQTVSPDAHYEFALLTPGAGTQHFYFQRFLRDDKFVRLLSGDPEASPTRQNTNSSPNHSVLVVSRMREWYAMDDRDRAGDETDILNISTQSPSGNQEPVDAIVSGVGNASIGLHIHDDAASPQETTLSPLPYFDSQAFQYGVDVYMPAADPPDGTITVTNMPRGDTSKPQTLNMPNWSSEDHFMSVVFSDFPIE